MQWQPTTICDIVSTLAAKNLLIRFGETQSSPPCCTCTVHCTYTDVPPHVHEIWYDTLLVQAISKFFHHALKQFTIWWSWQNRASSLLNQRPMASASGAKAWATWLTLSNSFLADCLQRGGATWEQRLDSILLTPLINADTSHFRQDWIFCENPHIYDSFSS